MEALGGVGGRTGGDQHDGVALGEYDRGGGVFGMFPGLEPQGLVVECDFARVHRKSLAAGYLRMLRRLIRSA